MWYFKCWNIIPLLQWRSTFNYVLVFSVHFAFFQHLYVRPKAVVLAWFGLAIKSTLLMKIGSIRRLDRISHCRKGNRILIADKNIENHWIVKIFFFFFPLFDTVRQEWGGLHFWARIETFFPACWYAEDQGKIQFWTIQLINSFSVSGKTCQIQRWNEMCFFFRCAVKISFLHLNAQLKQFNWMERKRERGRKREREQRSHAGVEMDEFSSFLIIYYIRSRTFFLIKIHLTPSNFLHIILNEKAFNQT